VLFVIGQYKTEDNENIFDIKFSIDDQLFWETFKIMLRGKTISYSTFKKKERENNVVTSNTTLVV
jgi:hypothetical protein